MSDTAIDNDTKTTTDHDTIRTWITKRQGYPAHVKSTQEGDDPGLLTVGFQNPDGKLEEISWDQFFQAFEKNALAFLYQEKQEDSEYSRFNKFIARD